MKVWGTFCFLFCLIHASTVNAVSLTPSEVKLEVEKRAVAYFVDNAHPLSGLVLDRADNFDSHAPPINGVASIAATGFGIAVLINAGERGLVSKEFAHDYTLKVLRFVEASVDRYRGWFLHWVDWETGKRMWGSEYSTIDTALFVAGALYAAQVYPNSEISKIAYRIYNAMDFEDMRTNGGAAPNKMTLSMGYELEQGYIAAEWNMYAEQMVLILLGMGHPTKPLPVEAWSAWERRAFPYLTSPSQSAWGLDQALFVHQYSQLFIDFRRFIDRFGDYHHNSVAISQYHRSLRVSDHRYASLREGFWGFSAGDSPGDIYRVFSALFYEGTVCVGCAVGSAMFLPQEVMADMTEWVNGPFRDRIWGRYGFVDSLDVDQNWYARVVLAITVAPAYMSLANMEDSTSVWNTFMKIPEIQNAMSRAQTASVPDTLKLSLAQ